MSNNVIVNVSIFKSVIMYLSMYGRQHRMTLENILVKWVITYDCFYRLTYLSSSPPVGHKATTMLRHKVLSFAEAWASPQDSPISFSSAITDCRHVIFGLPRFLFLGGVHLSATLGMLSWGIRRTCPSHLSRLRLISRTALLQPVFL